MFHVAPRNLLVVLFVYVTLFYFHLIQNELWCLVTAAQRMVRRMTTTKTGPGERDAEE